MDDLLLQRDARRNGKDGSLDLRRRQDKPADDPLCIASTSKAAAEIKIGSSALGHLDHIPSAPTRWFGSVPNAVAGSLDSAVSPQSTTIFTRSRALICAWASRPLSTRKRSTGRSTPAMRCDSDSTVSPGCAV